MTNDPEPGNNERDADMPSEACGRIFCALKIRKDGREWPVQVEVASPLLREDQDIEAITRVLAGALVDCVQRIGRQAATRRFR